MRRDTGTVWSWRFISVSAFCIRWIQAAAPSTEGVSVTQQSTDGGDLRGGPKAAAQQAKGMEPLDLLAVGHIALASGHVLDVPGIDEEHREASCLQNFIERDPIHAGRLHRDGIDVTRREPVGQVDERMREAPELPHRLLGSVWGDRHPMVWTDANRCT